MSASQSVAPAAVSAADPPSARQGVRTWALGVVALGLTMGAAATGVGLLFFYRPAAELVHRDLLDLEAGAFGFLRPLHLWSSHLLLVVVALHLLRVFLAGRHKPPRHVNWGVGVALLALVAGLAATGALLAWDGRAAWLRSAAGVTAESLPRVYALHCAVLPLLAAALVVEHLRRARRDGGADGRGNG